MKKKTMGEDFINLENKPSKKKDTVFSVLVILLVLILVFGFVALREYSAREILSTASERVRDQVEERFPPAEEAPEEEPEEEVEVAVQKEFYTEKAQSGEGLTHLARRALTNYMQEEGLNLTEEERIYIEDYVQKRLPTERADKWLDLGEEVEISRDLLEEAVEEAQTLTPAQIDNLSGYAALVAF